MRWWSKRELDLADFWYSAWLSKEAKEEGRTKNTVQGFVMDKRIRAKCYLAMGRLLKARGPMMNP